MKGFILLFVAVVFSCNVWVCRGLDLKLIYPALSGISDVMIGNQIQSSWTTKNNENVFQILDSAAIFQLSQDLVDGDTNGVFSEAFDNVDIKVSNQTILSVEKKGAAVLAQIFIENEDDDDVYFEHQGEHPMLYLFFHCEEAGRTTVTVRFKLIQYSGKTSNSASTFIEFSFQKICGYLGTNARTGLDVLMYENEGVPVVVDGKAVPPFTNDFATPYKIDSEVTYTKFCLQLTDPTSGIQPFQSFTASSSDSRLHVLIGGSDELILNRETCVHVNYVCKGVEETLDAVIQFRVVLGWFKDVTWSLRKQCLPNIANHPKINVATDINTAPDVVMMGTTLHGFSSEDHSHIFIGKDKTVVFYITATKNEDTQEDYVEFLNIQVKWTPLDQAKVAVYGPAAQGGTARKTPVPFWIVHECTSTTDVDVTVQFADSAHDVITFKYTKKCYPVTEREPSFYFTANQLLFLFVTVLISIGLGTYYYLNNSTRQKNPKHREDVDNNTN